MSPLPTFFEREVEDQYVRENFRKLREFVVKETPFLGFRFFELEFKAPATDFDFKHNLGFQPQDAILTFASNGSVVTFSYDFFSKDTVRVSVSKECKIRILLGAFQ